MSQPLDGWDITRADDVDWMPWGGDGNARAKVLGSADGYVVALVDAEAGYEGDPHDHDYAEFSYVIEGTVRTQGQLLHAGDGYAAAAGSKHTQFTAETPARYLVIFRL